MAEFEDYDKQLEEFNKEMDEFSDKLLPAEFILFHRKVGMQMLRGLVLKTPVGNPNLWEVNKGKEGKAKLPPDYIPGRARGNWQISINAPAAGEIPGVDKGGGTTITKGRVNMSGLKFGDTIYATNNLEYMSELEEGHSTQAPNGMLKLTFVEILVQFGL